MIGCTVLCLSACGLHANAQAVKAWQATITIPTYELGPPDPDPPFPLVSKHDVYPYTMLDDLTGARAPKTFQALYLENSFLRITVLPELGGHVYSIYDKVNRRDVLYRNHVIKYGLVGPRGAWIAGGMEFSFPFAHTTITVSPVESMLRQNPDGSASVVIGAIDRVSDMFWEIALTLRPNTARLQEDVTLFNATAQRHLYLFWTNTAVKATDDLQYIYPMREVIKDDPFAPVQSWPTWDGIDHSWYKNVPGEMAIFARNVHRNFFGVYYHDSNYGIVHVANFRKDPGKKIWTWGTARSGRIWDKLLSDQDGPYNEIQSGRFYTQGYREFMRPYRVEEWSEYWYPVSGLQGGFVQATPQAALNVDFPTAATKGASVAVKLSPAAAVSGAVLRVKQEGKLVKEVRGLDLRPLHPVTYSFPVQDVRLARRDLDVEVLSSRGQEVLHWSAAEPLDGNPDFVPRAGKVVRIRIPDSPQTPTEALYLRGVFLEQTEDLPRALQTYQQVLRRDPSYVPALLRLAWHHYRRAEFSAAEQLLARASRRNQDDPGVQYAAGMVYRAEGRFNAAKDAFWSVVHNGGPEPPSLIQIGEIEIRQGNYGKAEAALRQAIDLNPKDAFARADLSVAERLDGNIEQAAKAVAQALDEMPLLPYAVAEQVEEERSGPSRPPASLSIDTRWKQIVARTPSDALAVAAWYHSLGAWHSADDVLATAKSDPAGAFLVPLMDYYLASDARNEGGAQKASLDANEAAHAKTTAVFPSRLEDVAVLSEELQRNPQDPQADYELGNFWFAHGRYEDAAKLWGQAIGAGFHNSVLLRNIGVYNWRVKHNLEQAAGDYRKAIELSPQQYRLYYDLDQIYEEEGNSDARTKLFQDAPPSVPRHDIMQARHALFLIEQKRYDEALSVLADHHFTPWEGGVAVHNLFVSANLLRGQQELASQQPAQAEKYFREAMRYPENLGTGEPPNPPTAEALYWLGNALQAEEKRAQAVAAWKQAARQQSESAEPCPVFPALALEKLGEQQTAQRLLQQCIHDAAQPNAGAGSLFSAGVAEQYSHDDARARENFKQALAADPLYWEARIALTAIQ